MPASPSSLSSTAVTHQQPATMLRGSSSGGGNGSTHPQSEQQQQLLLRRDLNEYKVPLHPGKDAAERPFDPDQFYKGTESFEQRPSNISYFPNQVLQVSYLVSVMMKNDSISRSSSALDFHNSQYLTDLIEAMDVLATELAPLSYPELWVREITTSIDGWFPVDCPPHTNLENCQDITSLIGIYLHVMPDNGDGGIDIDQKDNRNASNNDEETVVDASKLEQELETFRVSLTEAIANNRLQAIVESFYDGGNALPPVYVIPIRPQDNGGEEIIDSSNTSNDEEDFSGNNNGSGNETISEDNDDTDSIQIGSNGTETGNLSGDTLTPTGNSSDTSVTGNDGGGSSGSSDGGLPDDTPSTPSGGDSLPTINNNTMNQNSMSTGGIVGLVLVALAVVLIIFGLVYRRRRSRNNNSTQQSRSRYSGASVDFRKNKSLASEVDKEDVVSSDSSKMTSLNLLLYAGVQKGETLESSNSQGETDHSRGTAPTVSASTSTMSETTEGSGSSTSPSGKRGTETWKKNEVTVPFNTSRELFTLDIVDEEKRSEDDEDDRDPLLASSATSGLNLAATSSSTSQCVHANHDADDESSPMKKRDEGTEIVRSPGVASTDASQISGMTEIIPLSSLDEAIMNGDWAAVGATAALMAASISPDALTKRPPYRRPSLTSPPPEKADLDRLIEHGDWHAVMMAAARYDAETGASSSMGEEASRSARSRSSTQGSDTADGSYYSGNDISSAQRGSATTNSGSQKERIQEIRSMVQQMVRDVVPDEAENVDEMMTQFKGKEEELLETLRTMKERDVAKKARMEAQKIARRNTRSREKDDEFPRANVPAVDPTAVLSEEEPREAPGSSDSVTCSTGDDDTDFSPQLAAAGGIRGSFAQATKADPDSAAAAAAEWAIERSLSELMEKELASSPSSQCNQD